MLKKILFVGLGIALINLLFEYFCSPDFQKYGDENKVQWTCRVNSLLAELHMIMSKYENAQKYYEPIVTRCPGTPLAADAEYNIADCLDKRGFKSEAMSAYQDFVEKYPNSSHARVAIKNIELIKGSR